MNTPPLSKEEIQERLEHRDALLDIRDILSRPSGQRFFRYLFKTGDVGELPTQGLEGNLLYERIGVLRAGNAIFKLVSEADQQSAANLLAQIEKERYVALYGSEDSNGHKET